MSYWYRRVFLLALPLILSNLTGPLLSTVDTVLSGHLPGAAALGGVAVGGIFFNTIFWTFGFLRMATTGLVAQAFGAGDDDLVLHHFGRALLAAVLIGVAVLLVRGPLISVSLDLLGAGAAARANAAIYCGIRIWSAPATLANYVILGYLLGKQRARTALLLQASINVINLLVALFLVLGRHWGVAGIATATLTAEWMGCLLGLGLMVATGIHPAHMRWNELMHGPSLKQLLVLNRDIFLRTLSLVAAYAWFTRSGARAGDVVLAANAVLLNFHTMAAYGLDGFANATEALVGQAIGSGRREDYRAVLKSSTILAFGVAASISVAYLIFGRQIIGLFTNQEPVRLMAQRYLPWVIALPIVSIFSFQFDGIFIGATRAGELRDSMLISFAGFLGLAIWLGGRYGDGGLWCALLCFMLLRAITLAMRLPRLERTSFHAATVEV